MDGSVAGAGGAMDPGPRSIPWAVKAVWMARFVVNCWRSAEVRSVSVLLVFYRSSLSSSAFLLVVFSSSRTSAIRVLIWTSTVCSNGSWAFSSSVIFSSMSVRQWLVAIIWEETGNGRGLLWGPLHQEFDSFRGRTVYWPLICWFLCLAVRLLCIIRSKIPLKQVTERWRRGGAGGCRHYKVTCQPT